MVPIESVQVGDLVLTRNAKTGEEVYAEVLQVFETEDRPLLELVLESEDGVDTIRTTPEHPFAIGEDGLFVEAAELKPGDLVVGANGWLRVAAGTWLQERATGYNLEIAGEHTYFVGEAQAWVHNTGTGPCPCAGGSGSFTQIKRSRRSPFFIRVDPVHPGRPDPRFSIDSMTFKKPKGFNAAGFPRDQNKFWVSARGSAGSAEHRPRSRCPCA